MGWPVSSTTDEARVKWRIAMKFLIPAKFDVNRAIELYKAHEVRTCSTSNRIRYRSFFSLEHTQSRESGSYLD
jgi:hypothetical protein